MFWMFLIILYVDIKYYFFRVLEYIIENVEGLFVLKIFKIKYVLNFFKDFFWIRKENLLVI